MGKGLITEELVHGEVPLDLAEWTGTDRLIREVLEAVQGEPMPRFEVQYVAGGERYRFEMILTLLVYAYARGVLESSEIESRCLSEQDFRYLASPNCPDSSVLRMFRRRERIHVSSALSRLIRTLLRGPRAAEGIDVDAEVGRRLEGAIAADNLALDY